MVVRARVNGVPLSVVVDENDSELYHKSRRLGNLVSGYKQGFHLMQVLQRYQRWPPGKVQLTVI